MTQTRRDYILAMLERNLKGGTWIRISERELQDFGGSAFFAGCQVTYVDDAWFTTKSKSGYSLDHDRNRTQIQLPWKIQAPSGGWRPGYTPPTVSFTMSANTTSSAHYYLSNEPTDEGKKPMEHHINRETLLQRVTGNRDDYRLALAQYKDLYAEEWSNQSERHVRGEIPQNQVLVKNKDGGIMTVHTDMSSVFDGQIEELELDSRHDVILTHEEYLAYVNGVGTNLKVIQDGIKELEELP